MRHIRIVALALLCLGPSLSWGWEISTPRTRGISDQGDYPYCAFHAMATFLESWGNKDRHRRRLPPLDPGYLALSANLEASNGAFWLNRLIIIAAKHGVIPLDSEAVEGEHWPYPQWREDQKKLLDTKRLQEIVEGRYRHQSTRRSFTGREYLDRKVGIAFEDFRWVKSTYEEPNLFDLFGDLFLWEGGPKKEDPDEEEIVDAYRQGSFAKMKAALNEDAKDLGIETKPLELDPDDLYQAIKHQLYRERPVLLSIYTSFVDGSFSALDVMSTKDLMPYGEIPAGKHAVVAVAHCDRWRSRNPICRRFAREMKAKKVRDCVAIQNSWGRESHRRGYVCISKKALEPMLYSAILTTADIESR